jgi:hypothetical protein
VAVILYIKASLANRGLHPWFNQTVSETSRPVDTSMLFLFLDTSMLFVAYGYLFIGR